MRTLLSMLARYNRWANIRIYDAAAALPDADYRADLGAAFRSVHGTLNHLVATDLIWLSRFTGAGDAPRSLDAIVADDLTALGALREATDARITDWVAGLTDAALTGPLAYVPMSTPTPVTQPLAGAAVHLFNHHTHHRGQVHALLTRLAGTAPSLDLIAYQRQNSDDTL